MNNEEPHGKLNFLLYRNHSTLLKDKKNCFKKYLKNTKKKPKITQKCL